MAANWYSILHNFNDMHFVVQMLSYTIPRKGVRKQYFFMLNPTELYDFMLASQITCTGGR